MNLLINRSDLHCRLFWRKSRARRHRRIMSETTGNDREKARAGSSGESTISLRARAWKECMRKSCDRCMKLFGRPLQAAISRIDAKTRRVLRESLIVEVSTLHVVSDMRKKLDENQVRPNPNAFMKLISSLLALCDK